MERFALHDRPILREDRVIVEENDLEEFVNTVPLRFRPWGKVPCRRRERLFRGEESSGHSSPGIPRGLLHREASRYFLSSRLRETEYWGYSSRPASFRRYRRLSLHRLKFRHADC